MCCVIVKNLIFQATDRQTHIVRNSRFLKVGKIMLNVPITSTVFSNIGCAPKPRFRSQNRVSATIIIACR